MYNSKPDGLLLTDVTNHHNRLKTASQSTGPLDTSFIHIHCLAAIMYQMSRQTRAICTGICLQTVQIKQVYVLMYKPQKASEKQEHGKTEDHPVSSNNFIKLPG